MKEKIIQYLEKELSLQEKIAFEQALKSDPDLQKAFEFQKAQLEKLEMLRFHAKAGDFLKSYNEVEMEEAPSEPRRFAFMTVRRMCYAALAAAILLLLFNYNSLINWIKPSVPTAKSSEIVADKPATTPVELAPSVSPEPLVSPAPSVAPVTPNPKSTVAVPTPKRPQSTKPAHITPKPRIETAEVIKIMPTKIGSATPDDSIFLANPVKKDTITSKMPIDSSTISLDNMYDFKGTNGLIFKHLSKIDCNHYTVSFVIKADGTVEQPRLEKGDKNCEILLLNQIKTMPSLKKPSYDGKLIDYRYFFTKD